MSVECRWRLVAAISPGGLYVWISAFCIGPDTEATAGTLTITSGLPWMLLIRLQVCQKWVWQTFPCRLDTRAKRAFSSTGPQLVYWAHPCLNSRYHLVRQRI